VLAHELTHVTQRHIVRSMINSQRQSLASTAALIVGLLLATRSNVSPNAAQAVITTGQAAAIQGQLNFSRDMEREADRIGWQILTQAGFAPNGMAAMFEKLDSSHHLNDSNQYPYLRSHPLTIERIADARLRAGDVPMAGSTEALRQHPSPAEHLLMQVRSRVLMDTSEPSLRRAQMLGAPGSPDVTATRLGALYGAALASSLLREPTTAEQALAAGRQLIRSHHGDAPALHRVFELLHLEILAQRNALQALAQLQTSPLLAQEDTRPTLLLRAQVALAAWRAAPDATAAHTALRQSTQALQTRVVLHRQDVLAWQTLAQTAQASGQALRAARASAEAVAIQGDLPGAIDRLRTAQQSVRGDASADYVELSVIQSRLRELEAERRHQAAQAKGED
jgi:beta-barrel assembly-enhancing protease